MKQSCPKCGVIVEINEKDYNSGEVVKRPCPTCGDESILIFRIPKENEKPNPKENKKEEEYKQQIAKLQETIKGLTGTPTVDPATIAQINRLKNEIVELQEKLKKEQESKLTRKKLKWIILTLSALIIIVSGIIIYFCVIAPYIKDKKAPRYYTYANSLKLRSTPDFEASNNKLESLPYGTEIIVYDSMPGYYYYGKVKTEDAEGTEIKSIVGYVKADYVMNKADYTLLNSIYGNTEAKKMLDESRYRKALLSYYKQNNIIGDLSDQDIYEAGLDSSLVYAEKWQVFCREQTKAQEPNNVYRSKKYRKNSKNKDLAVIIQNINTGNRILLYYYFDDDGTPHKICEQVAPKTGYMKEKTLKLERFESIYRVKVEYTD